MTLRSYDNNTAYRDIFEAVPTDVPNASGYEDAGGKRRHGMVAAGLEERGERLPVVGG